MDAELQSWIDAAALSPEDRQAWIDMTTQAPGFVPLLKSFISGDPHKLATLARSYRLEKKAFADGDEKMLEKMLDDEDASLATQ